MVVGVLVLAVLLVLPLLMFFGGGCGGGFGCAGDDGGCNNCGWDVGNEGVSKGVFASVFLLLLLQYIYRGLQYVKTITQRLTYFVYNMSEQFMPMV